MQRLFSHIDLRVRERERAARFYDAFLANFGFFRVPAVPGDDWETWRRREWAANDEFFGFAVDPDLQPNQNRIAFQAASREHVDTITQTLRAAGARDVDGPEEYDGYYATFFEDPDGNLLEVCFLEKHGGRTGS